MDRLSKHTVQELNIEISQDREPKWDIMVDSEVHHIGDKWVKVERESLETSSVLRVCDARSIKSNSDSRLRGGS